MRFVLQLAVGLFVLTGPLLGQGKRLWVLRAPDEMVEYDSANFAAKGTVKVPAEAAKSPTSLQVNRLGQILFETTVSLPLSDEEAAPGHKIWIWNGSAATTIDQGIERKTVGAGSNQAVTESAPAAYLSADGKHLFWSANEARRLQREQVDLSTATTWKAWETDLSGAGPEQLVSTKLPECRCTTGSCEDTCPVGIVWIPDAGVERSFWMTQFVAGQTAVLYKSSTRYQEEGGKWTASAFPGALQRVLDSSADGNTILEAIPDTGCCGWSNQSNDQTLVVADGKTHPAYDERETYNNPDYDISFFTPNARFSPNVTLVAMTIASTAQSDKAIQETQDGQANPEESQRIRRALAELPGVSVKSVVDSSKQLAFVRHALLVGWLNDKELLIVEDHVLVAYNVATGASRKSNVRVEDAAHVFLR